MIPQVQQAAGMLLSGTAVLVASSEVPQEFSLVKSVAEVGSFGLIAFAGIFLLLRGLPAFLATLERSQTNFLGALEKERDLREKARDDFREMLAAHKKDLGERMSDVNETLEKGNKLTGDLVKELQSRPCRIGEVSQ